MYQNTNKYLYCQPIIDNIINIKFKIRIKIQFFNCCQINGLSNITDSNITNNENSIAISNNVSNNISTNQICFTATVHHQTKLLKNLIMQMYQIIYTLKSLIGQLKHNIQLLILLR